MRPSRAIPSPPRKGDEKRGSTGVDWDARGASAQRLSLTEVTGFATETSTDRRVDEMCLLLLVKPAM